MAWNILIWELLLLGYSIQVLLATTEDDLLEYMSKEERELLKYVQSSIYDSEYHVSVTNFS